MNLNFILNGEDISLTADSNTSLYQVLKREPHLFEHIGACQKGTCGKCLISLDGKLVLSCLIPFFQIRNREIITLEGLRGTQEYQKLLKIFHQQEVPLCQECTALQLFQIIVLWESSQPVQKTQILETLDDIPCRCGTRPALEAAIEIFLEERKGPRRASD